MYVAAIFVLLTVLLYLQYGYSQNKANGKREAKRYSVKLGLGQSLYLITYFFIRGMNTPPFELVHDLQKIYGKVFLFSLVIKNKVFGIVSDIEFAKTILNGVEWINRVPEGHYITDFSWGKPYGLIFGNGDYNRVGRKLTHKIFHQLGVYRLSQMEQIITMEYLDAEECILEACSENEDSVVKISQNFRRQTMNVLYQLLVSERFEKGNKKGESLFSALEAGNRGFKVGTTLADVWPSLNKIPFFTMKPAHVLTEMMFADYEDHILKRRQSGSYRENPQDYIDYFMIEIDRHRCSEDAEYYSDRNLMCCLRDLVLAGTDTSSASLDYAVLHLAQNMDVQKRVQSEIDEVIGSRTPCYSDKAKMVYTQAFMLENLRCGTPVPISLHSPSQDVSLCGEKMSKGCAVLISIHSIHRNSDVWSDPDKFFPERFLNEEHDTIINAEKILPFGDGKRNCIGEFVAKITVFLFLVSLLQKFTFELSEKHPPPSTRGQFGIAKGPLPFYVKLRQR